MSWCGAAPLTGLLVIAQCAGCAVAVPATSEPRLALIERVPEAMPGASARPVSLLVLVPEASAPFATTRMAYTSRPHEIAYFSHHEWAATPARMIQPLIVRTLRDSGSFSAVVAAPNFGRHAYVLSTRIAELEQDFSVEPAMLVLSVEFCLLREPGGRIVVARELSVREPMRAATPGAGVAAANDAIAKVLGQMAILIIASTG